MLDGLPLEGVRESDEVLQPSFKSRISDLIKVKGGHFVPLVTAGRCHL